MSRVVSWFSCGAASAVATKLTLKTDPNAVVAYCETHAEHPDNQRFIVDCERWFGKSVTRLASDKFADTWDVWERKRYLAGIEGAPCTGALKFSPRLAWQQPTDVHVFGYTVDSNDRRRAAALRANYPEMTIRTPLIDAQLNKSEVLGLLERAGIALPAMYSLGFHNNNCIPCVKSQSPAYWALIRKQFPLEFERMVELSRRLNVRLVKIKGERRFIDEIPLSQSTVDPIQPACDFLCQMMEEKL